MSGDANTPEAREADTYLELIAVETAKRDRLKAEMQAEYEAVTAKYKDRLGSANHRVASLEQTLVEFSLLNREAIFAERDRVDLPHGALLWKVIERVKQARCVKGALLALEAGGLVVPLKRAVSVDWDKLSDWTDAQLAEVGTVREKLDVVEYELVASSQ